MMIIKVSLLSYIICMLGASQVIQYLWCIHVHVLHTFISVDTGDFAPNDDYQGINKMHNLYAWNWPHYNCAFVHVYTLPLSSFGHW